MITLKKLLRLQLFYYLLGMIFNAVSIYMINTGQGPLTPNEPIQGSIVMTIYALFLIPGFYGRVILYRLLMFIAVLLLGYGGVFNHWQMIQSTPELYHSNLSGCIGAGINVFGLLLNVLAVLGKFDQK